MNKLIRLTIFGLGALAICGAIAIAIFVFKNRSGLEQLAINFVTLKEHISSATTSHAPHILFVGNSLTYCFISPNTVETFAQSLVGVRPDVDQIVIPGCTLEQHYKNGKFQALLKGSKYDYVVLQEQSGRALDNVQNTLIYAQKMSDLARLNGAKVIYFEVWADRNLRAEQVKISGNATLVASQTRARLAPIGDAFFSCADRFPSINLYDKDRHHPSKYGAYLASSVLFQAIYRKSAIGAPCDIYYQFDQIKVPVLSVSAEDAKNLQRLAASY